MIFFKPYPPLLPPEDDKDDDDDEDEDDDDDDCDDKVSELAIMDELAKLGIWAAI